MPHSTDKNDSSGPTPGRWALAMAVALLGALAISLIIGDVEILKRSMDTSDAGNDLGSFTSAVDNIRGPANLALMTVVPVGLIAGGGMMAAGSRKGIQVMGASAGAGALVLLGNGLVA